MRKIFNWLLRHFLSIFFGFITLFLIFVSLVSNLTVSNAFMMLLFIICFAIMTAVIFSVEKDEYSTEDYCKSEPTYDGKNIQEIEQTIKDLTRKVTAMDKELGDMKVSYDEIKHLMEKQDNKNSEYYKYLKDNAKKISANTKKTKQMRDQLYAQVQILEGKQSELKAASIMAEAQKELNKTLYGESGLDDVIKDLEDNAEFELDKAEAKIELNSKSKKTRNWPGAVL